MTKSFIVVIGVALASPIFLFGDNFSTPTGMAGSAKVEPSLDTDVVLEQGKELYATGQYMAALDKFMKVLRRDPRQPEAREYLQLVVDQLRHKRQPADAKSVAPMTQAVPYAPLKPFAQPPDTNIALTKAQEDYKRNLRQRQLFAADLAAIPGVKVIQDSKNMRIEIDTPILFADKTGGLKEDGVPVLDRVAAWLKTFGNDPVAIHCYPEEREDLSLGGSLFLHRYAQLYGYFVDERKIPTARFIAAGPLVEESKSKDSSPPTTTPLIVIIAMGGAESTAWNTIVPSASRWIEFSMVSLKPSFNPDEGEWATLDLAALTPKKVISWKFAIYPIPANTSKVVKGAESVLSLEGKGNLLRRVTWDGRNMKTNDFVSAGRYLCKLVAYNADGTNKSEETVLQVTRSRVQPVSLTKRSKPKPAVAKTLSPEAVAAPSVNKSAAPSEPAAPTPSSSVAAEAVVDAAENEDSSNAIWKQVIQFDENESDLKPTVKASLERIGKTLEVYPLQKVRITGFAMASEPNAKALAKERANRVRQTLVGEYHVDPKRVLMAESKVGGSSKVEISITN